MISTLAKGEVHVRRIIEDMSIPSNAVVSLPRFLSTAQQTFGTWALDTQSLLRSLRGTRPASTVAPPGGVVFEMASLLASHIILQGLPLSLSCTRAQCARVMHDAAAQMRRRPMRSRVPKSSLTSRRSASLWDLLT
jgi:hypothetical protein